MVEGSVDRPHVEFTDEAVVVKRGSFGGEVVVHRHGVLDPPLLVVLGPAGRLEGGDVERQRHVGVGLHPVPLGVPHRGDLRVGFPACAQHVVGAFALVEGELRQTPGSGDSPDDLSGDDRGGGFAGVRQPYQLHVVDGHAHIGEAFLEGLAGDLVEALGGRHRVAP